MLEVRQAKVIIVKSPSALRDRRIALFVSYNKNPIIKPHVTYHLKHLKAQGFICILILVTDDVDIVNVAMKTMFVDGFIVRENIGHDFGAWADAFRSHTEIWEASEILLINDSVFGPINNYGITMNSARKSHADFVSMTESYEINRHYQSYFMFMKFNMIKNNYVRDFWMNLENLNSRDEVIKRYEVNFLESVIRHGLKTEALFPFPVAQTPEYCNPTHVFWEHLIVAGFPYLKIDLLRDNPMNLASVDRWPRYIKDKNLLKIINDFLKNF